jgi:hypothetical protein
MFYRNKITSALDQRQGVLVIRNTAAIQGKKMKIIYKPLFPPLPAISQQIM